MLGKADNKAPDVEEKAAKNEETQKQKEAADKAAKQEIDKVLAETESDGEGGILQIGPLAKKAGRPIEIYDEEGRRIKTIGSELGGEPIKLEYQKPNGTDRPQGHWKSLTAEQTQSDGTNNCLYDAVAANLPPGSASAEQLRQETAREIMANRVAYEKAAPHIGHLREQAAERLCPGGFYYDRKTDTVVIEDDDVIGMKGVKRSDADNYKKKFRVNYNFLITVSK